MVKNETEANAEQVAMHRLEVILPLCVPNLGRNDRIRLQHEAENRWNVSYRTVGRWFDAYQENGFEGLKPKPMPQKEEFKVISNEVLELAIEVRKENPSRSVEDLILILESEGKIEMGVLKRSTLQRYLDKAGYSTSKMKKYLAKPGTAAFRFQKKHRMELMQGDVKYGPTILVDGKETKTYWVCWIDDCTRYITHAEFYVGETTDDILDALRKSIDKAGLPLKIMIDNGPAYRAEDLKKVCARLGIAVNKCKPYSPESKGKQERCNRDLDKFIEEARLSDFRSLEELNLYNKVWVSETHNEKGHSALPGRITPRTAFRTDSRCLRYVDPEKLDSAFIQTKSNVSVDQTGIFHFRNCMYQVKDMNLAGSTVVIAWPPLHYEQMYVWCDAKRMWTTAEPFEIGPHIDYELRASFAAPEEVKVEGSRLFDALLKTYAGKHPDACIYEDLETVRVETKKKEEERKAEEHRHHQDSTFSALTEDGNLIRNETYEGVANTYSVIASSLNEAKEA